MGQRGYCWSGALAKTGSVQFWSFGCCWNVLGSNCIIQMRDLLWLAGCY